MPRFYIGHGSLKSSKGIHRPGDCVEMTDAEAMALDPAGILLLTEEKVGFLKVAVEADEKAAALASKRIEADAPLGASEKEAADSAAKVAAKQKAAAVYAKVQPKVTK